MSKKTKLQLLKEESKKHPKLDELQMNSFWNTCGSTQDHFPCSICKTEKVGQNWSINSPEHNNCFWEYVADKSFSDGFMNPLSQAETAKLMGCSPTAIHMIEKEALNKLKNSPYFDILREFLTQEPSDSQNLEESEHSVSISYSEPDEYGDD